MDKFKRTIIVGFLGLLGFFFLLGIVGDYDYCEQIILHMSQEQYDSVRNHLEQLNGRSPSDSDIAHWWVEHNKHLP